MNGKRVMGVLFAGLMAWSIGSACAQTMTGEPRGGVAASPAATRLDPAVVQANMQNLQQQATAINQLADRFQTDAAAQFGAGFNAIDWKRDFGARLMYQPLESLSAALTAPDLSMAQKELFNASQKMRAKHDTNNAWVINYLAAPCRIVDTRFGGGGMLGPAYRLWYASTPTAANIAAQGGNAAGCGSFPNADGFLLYVTVVPAVAGPNFLTVQHNNSPTPPATATMTYYSQVISNFAITSCQGCSGSDGGFFAYASGNTHVVVDLLAWTGTLGPVALDCVDVSKAGIGTANVLNNTEFDFTSAAACAAGYTQVATACAFGGASPAGLALTQNSGLAGYYACIWRNQTGLTLDASLFNTQTRCCRVPGL
jgi:hypothetical protein